jgi:hypothetical protein
LFRGDALAASLLSRWISATFCPGFDLILCTDVGIVFIVRFGMTTDSLLSQPADEALTKPRPASQRNSGEGAESVLSEIKRHHRVDELVNHGPENDSPLPASGDAVAVGS